MDKKFWIGVVVVFVVMSVASYLIHGVLLASAYQSPEVMKFMRPAAEMMGMMWIYYVVYLILAFFMTLIFSKGYEGTGMAEGLRYGFYVGCLMATPMAYSSYAMLPMPYSLALQWFMYGMVEYIILGVLLSLVYGSTKKAPAAA